MRHTFRTLVAGLAVGCTWISQGAYEEQLDTLDEDKDGTPHAKDCDDQDPLRGDLEEVPYDAVDNDCSLKPGVNFEAGDVDADGDSFPGISQEEYEALAKDLKNPLAFPSGFVGKPLDCDDNDAGVFPSDDDDVPYDGVDSNCDRKNDFDKDGDGFISARTPEGEELSVADVDTFVARYGITPAEVEAWGPGGAGGPVEGDCDDEHEQFFPGATVEDLPYDGLDYDCDGTDEYDQDGDGHLAPGYANAWQTFQTRYFRTGPVKPDDDCADGPDVPDIQGVAYRPKLDLAVAATVYPGAGPDLPYDGIDTDCGGDDDFDVDGDGYVPDAYLADRDLMVATWGYEGEEWADHPGGDCDDDSITGPAIHPDTLDILFDSIDQDCDGKVDLSYLNFGDGPNVTSLQTCDTGGYGAICWSGPSNPELLVLDDEFHLYGSAMVFDAPDAPPSPQYEVLAGAAIRFDVPDAIGGAEPRIVDGRSWLRTFPPNPLNVLATSIDVTEDATPGGLPCNNTGSAGDVCHYIVLGGAKNPGGYGELHSAVLQVNNGVFSPLPRTVGEIATNGFQSLDTDAASYAGTVEDVGIFVQCGAAGLNGKLTTDITSVADTNIGGDVCFFYTDPTVGPAPMVELCDAGSCDVYEFAGTTFQLGSPDVSADHWRWGDRENGLTLLVDPAGRAFVRTDPTSEYGTPPTGTGVFSGENVLSFDLAADAGRWYLVAVTSDRRVLLEVMDAGNPGSAQEIEIDAEDPSNPSWEPTGVAIAVSGSTVALAVTREDLGSSAPRPGNIGWTFLGTP